MDNGEQTLASALAKASILQLTKCSEILKRRAEVAVKRRAKVSLREAWVLVAAGSDAQVTQKQIARNLALNQNVMVQLLDKLEKSRHVRRIRNSRNRREQFVRLTPKGKSALRQLFANQAKIYRSVFAPLDEAQVTSLLHAAKTFLDSNN